MNSHYSVHSMNSSDTYWSLTGEQVLVLLGSSPTGISQQEASERLKRLGPNEIPRRSAVAWWMVLLEQFHNPLIYILLCAAALKYFIKGPIDALVIGAVVVLMTFLGFFQEMKAQQAMTSLLNLVAPKAKVRRDGNPFIVPCQQLVVGDVLVLEAGDRVPADGRLIETSHMAVAEAALTGWHRDAVLAFCAETGTARGPVIGSARHRAKTLSPPM